ncbi:MAG: DsbA family oxidoreductase [Altererythrobacter sp. XM-24bin4]|jgi:predicted DsbA family dithiol-disulfide isomerase|uniref:DsbA family oxidoreductase n=1 Tax=uncultured Altererythrobacter sp. TaxID=500840 RepID=UPI000D7A3B04|nr:DsbA family oxidoreductase [uncultured Altererythrobacter sp.]PWL25786.1 MAG: DsbA family oxidoreductase [Altererythrobacter sp. XM-24bin4]
MTDPAPHRMTIDIYSDVMCPWCLIGYGQLTKALGELDGEIEAQLRWRPFELNPDMPEQGEEQEAHLQRKYGRSAEEGAAVRGQLKSIADSAGVSLSYEGSGEAPPAMMWNTRAAHKLLTWALEEAGPSVQTDLKLALFKAHFNERQNVSDEGVLLDVAAGIGLHREAAKAALTDDELEARVIAEERQAWDLNISGVPAMIVNGKFMIPGAQSPETYVNALRRVAEKTVA